MINHIVDHIYNIIQVVKKYILEPHEKKSIERQIAKLKAKVQERDIVVPRDIVVTERKTDPIDQRQAQELQEQALRQQALYQQAQRSGILSQAPSLQYQVEKAIQTGNVAAVIQYVLTERHGNEDQVEVIKDILARHGIAPSDYSRYVNVSNTRSTFIKMQ